MDNEWWTIHEDDHLEAHLSESGIHFSTITGVEMKETANSIHSKYGIDDSPKVEITAGQFLKSSVQHKDTYNAQASKVFPDVFDGYEVLWFRRWRGGILNLEAKKIFKINGSDIGILIPETVAECTFYIPSQSFVLVDHFSRFYQYAGEPGPFWDYADKTIQAMYD